MKFTTSLLFRAGLFAALALLCLPAVLACAVPADPASMLVFGMAAATAEINTRYRAGAVGSMPVAANTKIWAGTLVAVDASGYAVPAADTLGLRAIGRAEATADNTGGAAGAINLDVLRGCFLFKNSATAPVGSDDVGKPCYIADDTTLAAASTNSVIAGLVYEVAGDGVWVDTQPAALLADVVAKIAAATV